MLKLLMADNAPCDIPFETLKKKSPSSVIHQKLEPIGLKFLVLTVSTIMLKIYETTPKNS